jgi:hypothetical protein
MKTSEYWEEKCDEARHSTNIDVSDVIKECQDEAFKEGIELAVEKCAESAKVKIIRQPFYIRKSSISEVDDTNYTLNYIVDKESILKVKDELLKTL